MTDAVNGVQSFKQWRAELPAEKQSMSTRRLRKLYREYKANLDAGVKVEKSDAQPLSEEQKAQKAENESKKRQEIEKMKAYAEKYKDKAGVGKNNHMTVNDDLSPDPDNNKELKDELLDRIGKMERPTSEDLLGTYGEELAKVLEPVLEEQEYRETHFDSHDAYINKKDYKADKHAQLEAGASRSDFKKNNTLVKSAKVKEFISRNFMTSDGRVDTQALKDYVMQYTGTDFEINYGIHKKHNGGIGQDEYRIAMQDTGLSRRQVRKLVEAAGGFSEKSDKAKKVALAGLAGTGVGAAIGAAFGSAIKATATASASASAGLVDVLGNVISGETASDFKQVVKNFVGPGAGLGALIGGVVAMGTTALAYNYDGKRDLMNGYEIAQVVKNPSLMLSGMDKVTDLDRVPVAMIETLKAAEIPDNVIVDAIKLAKGNATGSNVNINELISACEMLGEKYSTDGIAEPAPVEDTVPVEEPPKTETVKPEITAKPTQQDIAEEVTIERYHYDRKPGEYWFGIVKNMYKDENGKAISNADASKQASALKKAYGIAAKSADMPNALDLDFTIEIDGRTYKLDTENITREISNQASDGKIIKAERKDKTKTENVTYYGYEASASVEGEVKEQRTVTPESKTYKEAKARNEAMEQAKKELEQAHPPFEREVE